MAARCAHVPRTFRDVTRLPPCSQPVVGMAGRPPYAGGTVSPPCSGQRAAPRLPRRPAPRPAAAPGTGEPPQVVCHLREEWVAPSERILGHGRGSRHRGFRNLRGPPTTAAPAAGVRPARTRRDSLPAPRSRWASRGGPPACRTASALRGPGAPGEPCRSRPPGATHVQPPDLPVVPQALSSPALHPSR